MSEKTNVARIFDSLGLKYAFHTYEGDGSLTASEVAKLVGADSARVFKTLVTVGKSGRNYVFAIPAPNELDLKKAAKAAGEKSVEMLKLKDLLPTAGYVHGGCSPVGMKKRFPTFLHESARNFESILLSAGRIGAQVEISPGELAKAVSYSFADLVSD